MDTEQRSLGSQAFSALRQPAVWLVVMVSIAFGILLGWILFGTPHKITEVFADDGLLEWVTAGATILIGFGAWKYARATHFHTLDRADAEVISTYDEEVRNLFLLRSLVIECSSPQAGIKALETIGNSQIGVARATMLDARDSVGAITWPDGRAFVRSDEATKAFVELKIRARTFVKITNVAVSLFEENSVAEMTATHQGFFDQFVEAATKLVGVADKFSDELIKEVGRIRSDMESLDQRRKQRQHVFNFDP